MATYEANASIQSNTKPVIEVVRPLANFPPSIWGDQFLYFSLDDSKLEAYAKAMEEPKEDLRRLIVSPTMDSNAKLRLINSVYRLGLKYLFLEDIEGQLEKLFKDLDNEGDLYTISINFQVFRQHGYNRSCDVFNKFKDSRSGKFMETMTTDVRGMLSLYEAAQLRTKGEAILDEAFAFTEAQLKGVVDTLKGNLARQVKHALRSSLHRGIQIYEARVYLSNYQEECCTYDSLVKLAFAHFNYLQLLHKNELQILTKWYKDMEFQINYPFLRERLTELYLWITAIYYEPHYSQARIITTKIGQVVSMLDDIMDAYATIDEIRLLMDAISRWEMSAVEQIPEYTKPFYRVVLSMYAELEQQLSKQGRANLVIASRQAFQKLAGGYHQEAEWRHIGYEPSFEEYMKTGLITSAYDAFARAAVVGMSCASEAVISWYDTQPKILQASQLLGRLHNDVMSFKFEAERAHRVTGVDAYMKTFGVSETVAMDELMKILDNAWKDINECCLKPAEVSMEILTTILNLARMIDVVYKNGDEYTFPGMVIKEYVTLLFVDPINM